MTRHVLRAIDFGASVVFMAFCAKALFTRLYKDLVKGQLPKQRFPANTDGPSLITMDALAVRRLSPVPVQSAAHHRRQPSSY